MFENIVIARTAVLDVAERLQLPIDEAPAGLGVIGSAAKAYLFAKGLAAIVQDEVGGTFEGILDTLCVERQVEIDPDGGESLLTWWPGITVA